MEADVCLTAHELIAHRFIGLRDRSLQPDLIVDAQSLKHHDQVGTACTLGVGYGPGCENRVRQRSDRTDVGYGSAGAHCNVDARFGKYRAGSPDELTLL